MTIKKLKALSDILNIKRLCLRCHLNYNTIKNKLYNEIELTPEQSKLIDFYLESQGLVPGINITPEVMKRYSDKDCKNNPNKIFIFGDNTKRVGNGGQAQIRGNSNALGIATKINPGAFEDSYMKDSELESNKKVIDSDIQKIKDLGRQLVFPKDGLGTGLAELPQRAPQTYNYLREQLLLHFKFDNDLGTIIS